MAIRSILWAREQCALRMPVGAHEVRQRTFQCFSRISVRPPEKQSQFRILIPCRNISLPSLKSWAPIKWQVGAIRAQINSPKHPRHQTQMHKRSSHFFHKKPTKFATVAAANHQEEAQEDKMQVRRRRRGRRKSGLVDLVVAPFQLNSSTMLAAALTIALIAQTASSLTSASNENFSSDLSNPSRQLFKRQSPADGHRSAAAQAAFQNEDLDHHLNQPSNHYEEPLALALGGEDASQDSQQTSRQNKGKRTLYACEEKQLEIECQLGESIQLIRANYGRFSIQICNEHGQLDWKVNCMSSDSFDIIAKSCQAKQSCQLLASNEIFGDACPGTQKYLEVHYQCVTATAANRTEQEQQNPALPRVKPMGRPSIKPGTDVIQPQLVAATTTTTVTPTTINSENSAPTVARPNWPSPGSSQMQLPSWIPPSEREQIVIASPSPVLDSATDSINEYAPHHRRQGQWCPETMWRSIRWPATEAGRLAQMACPAHAQSSSHTVPPNGAATLYCKPDGQWASRAQLPGRCQSIWLRNLTQRLEAGDAPLSILAELVLRSSPLSSANGQNWPSSVYATSSLTATSDTARRTGRNGGTAPLFGEDLVQMGRIVGRLVDEMGELLARISDDKQRITWAREMIQLIVDLTSNLLDEQHSDAWWDLAGSVATPFSQAGERQRVAGQLLSGLESSSVLLAGALQHQARPFEPNSGNQDDFQRATEHVYVSIQSIALERSKSIASQRVQVAFPSQTSLMGARWINSEQRFTLNLQVSNAVPVDLQPQQQQDQPAGKHLKIVSVMLRGLGAYMEPATLQQQLVQELASDKSSPGDSSALQATRPLAINSDLVGFSIVADSTSQSGAAKVDLSAPIELVFKHRIPLMDSVSERPPTSGRPAHCVYWDTKNSDWSTAGCKLMASNRTHSVCACDHLTTFGLLNELDQMLAASGQQQPTSTQTTALATPTTTSGQMDLVRVHLDSVELTLDAFEMKPIYMARLLDGNLFTSQTGARTSLYVSCSLSGLLLAVLLAAAAYNRAHARRLLGSLPAEPPPSLLVANYHNQQQQLAAGNGRMQYHQSNGLHASNGPHSIETSTTNGASPPTSYSSAGQAASIDLLAASKQEQDELNNFYSLLNSGTATVDHSNYYGAQPIVKAHPSLQSGSRRHLAAKAATANDSAAKSLSQLALVPCHLIVQMLLLQLLLLLLIESQNLLAWNSQQAKRSVAQNSMALMTAFSQFSGGTSTSLPVALDQQPVAQNALDPLGFVTWLAVFALCYLASGLVCWLLTRMVQLSGHLVKLSNLIAGPKAASNGKQYQTIQTISSNALYQQQQPINRYGQCQLHNNGQQGSSSPSLSNFSNGLANDSNNFGRLEQLESRQFGKEPYNMSVANPQNVGLEPATNCSLAAILARLSTGRQLAWLLTHVLPVLTSSLLVWFSRERGQLINASAYTSSWSSQLAYWPLALNAAWTLPLAFYLYCLPSICLALGVVALLLLRRQFCQIYKTGQSNNGQLLFKQTHDERNYHLESQSDVTQTNQRGGRRGLSVGSSNNQLALELSIESKRAKFACLTLLALLALNSICWISFFTHCHQALAHQADGGGQNNHLILTFASSNLLISLLVCCSQRQQLKRACQLLGVSRFLALVTGRCCHLGGASKPSPASTSSVSSSSYYNHHQDQQQRQQAIQYGTGKSIKVPTATASQQSLFVISRSRPVGGAMLAEVAQPTYSANPQQQQATYGVQQHPMLSNQHLYQQLAAVGHGSQQHIYDSTTNLSQKAELAEAQKQRQWNALQLMAQQQQQQFNQQQSHEPMIHYTLGRTPTIGAPFHLNPQQHQSQYFHGPANMTLKPLPAANSVQQQQMSFAVQQQGARNNPHESFLCPISGEPNSHAKTHSASSSGRQQQLSASSSAASSSGEADGPLVAFAQPATPALNKRRHEFSIASANQSTSPATFGPMQFSSGMSNNQQQQQQQQATEHRPSSEANQSDNQSFGTPIGHSKLGGGQTNRAPIRHDCDQQKHLGGKQPNYTDALKAAMAQEASEQQHFRRSNSTALRQQQQPHRSFASSSTAASSSRMIDAQLDYRQASRDDCEGHGDNIYDVANCGQLASR